MLTLVFRTTPGSTPGATPNRGGVATPRPQKQPHGVATPTPRGRNPVMTTGYCTGKGISWDLQSDDVSLIDI